MNPKVDSMATEPCDLYGLIPHYLTALPLYNSIRTSEPSTAFEAVEGSLSVIELSGREDSGLRSGSFRLGDRAGPIRATVPGPARYPAVPRLAGHGKRDAVGIVMVFHPILVVEGRVSDQGRGPQDPHAAIRLFFSLRRARGVPAARAPSR
jgi:hypothetical protein